MGVGKAFEDEEEEEEEEKEEEEKTGACRWWRHNVAPGVTPTSDDVTVVVFVVFVVFVVIVVSGIL